MYLFIHINTYVFIYTIHEPYRDFSLGLTTEVVCVIIFHNFWI